MADTAARRASRRTCRAPALPRSCRVASMTRISPVALIGLPQVAPPDVMAYGKGGSIDWNGTQALAVAGRMVAGPVRADFFWAANWPGEADSVPPVVERLRATLRPMLARAVELLG